MPSNYNGNPAGITPRQTVTISEPVDTDVRNAASVQTPLRKLADFLHQTRQAMALAVMDKVLSMGGFKITNLGSGTASTDAVAKSQLDAEATARVSNDSATLVAAGAYTDWRFAVPPTFVAITPPQDTAGNYDPAYWKDSLGYVHFKGMIQATNSIAGFTLVTLPAGMRPAARRSFIVGGGQTTRMAYVDATGVVTLTSMNNTEVDALDVIYFYAEQ